MNPEIRLEQHIKDQSYVYRTHWIHSLLERGLKPTCTILERVEPSNDWEAREKYWIAKGREEGWQLTNLTSGGEGLQDPSPEVCMKISESRKGMRFSEEHRYRMSVAAKNRTEEYRLNMSKIMMGKLKGYKHSEKSKRNMSEARMGCNLSKETRQKISDSRMGHSVSKETRQKMSKSQRGENNPGAKLTSKEVLEIRHLISVDGIPKKDLAIAFGVSVGSIYNIVSFRTWKHLKG